MFSSISKLPIVPPFRPPWWGQDGLSMTVVTALWHSRRWQDQIDQPQPDYQERIWSGAGGVPIFSWTVCPENARGTIIGTYGITGSLEDQWFLQILGRKAAAQSYGVILFDWRAHGQTALLSPVLTSDGLYEGQDFVMIAAQAKAAGFPSPFWFTGYSLGGQLALWGIYTAQHLMLDPMILEPAGSSIRIDSLDPPDSPHDSTDLKNSMGPKPPQPPLEHPCLQINRTDLGSFNAADLGGVAVICPNLDSRRSLTYLVQSRWGRYLEKAIARRLQELAALIEATHPGQLDPDLIAQTQSIWGFDHAFVISRLGFSSVEAYYDASSPLPWLSQLRKPTLILYAADDPMFDPELATDLRAVADTNSMIDLYLTSSGGHVGYYSSRVGRQEVGDPDPWWAWNRVLEWMNLTVDQRQSVGMNVL